MKIISLLAFDSWLEFFVCSVFPGPHWVLAAAHVVFHLYCGVWGLSIVAGRIFFLVAAGQIFSCGTQTLSILKKFPRTSSWEEISSRVAQVFDFSWEMFWRGWLQGSWTVERVDRSDAQWPAFMQHTCLQALLIKDVRCFALERLEACLKGKVSQGASQTRLQNKRFRDSLADSPLCPCGCSSLRRWLEGGWWCCGLQRWDQVATALTEECCQGWSTSPGLPVVSPSHPDRTSWNASQAHVEFSLLLTPHSHLGITHPITCLFKGLCPWLATFLHVVL